jgi:hypothetical protein
MGILFVSVPHVILTTVKKAMMRIGNISICSERGSV